MQHRISAEAAFAQSRRNSAAKWPTREQMGQICSPALNPSFSLRPGESVFTIGSCFARHIEYVLQRNGYLVPGLNFEAPTAEAFDGNVASMLNKYTPGGMAEEVRAALRQRPSAFIEHDGGVIDLQLHAAAPVSRERAIERRQQVQAFYRDAIKSSRVAIITLGLIEAWWDSETETYLNNTPWPQVLAANKGRFQFEVLSIETTRRLVSEIIELLREARGQDLRVLLTVSPVPLARTFTAHDIIIANAHSKSVLRAVAGEIAEAYPFVDYYPSFESVTLSDDDVAWEDDFRHVTKTLVRHNVERMIAAYAASAASPSTA